MPRRTTSLSELIRSLTELLAPGEDCMTGSYFWYARKYPNFYITNRSIFGYKKIRVEYYDDDGHLRSGRGIAYLEIPKGAKVYAPSHHGKMRASSAWVRYIGVIGKQGGVGRGWSIYSGKFTYRLGCKVRPSSKFSMAARDCESGIHFFRTYTSAKGFNF